MTDLLFQPTNNMAGLLLVRYVTTIGLTDLPLIGPAVFKPGHRWFTIYGSQWTKDYKEDQTETDNGDIWSIDIQLFFPGDSEPQRAAINQLTGRHRFVVETQDNIGIWRRTGTISEGLSLSYKFGIDQSAGGRRGTSIRFSGDLTARPPIVLGS